MIEIRLLIVFTIRSAKSLNFLQTAFGSLRSTLNFRSQPDTKLVVLSTLTVKLKVEDAKLSLLSLGPEKCKRIRTE